MGMIVFVTASAHLNPWRTGRDMGRSICNGLTLDDRRGCGLSLPPPRRTSPRRRDPSPPYRRTGQRCRSLIDSWFPLTDVINTMTAVSGHPYAYRSSSRRRRGQVEDTSTTSSSAVRDIAALIGRASCRLSFSLDRVTIAGRHEWTADTIVYTRPTAERPQNACDDVPTRLSRQLPRPK